MLWLASWAIFVFVPGMWTPASFAITVACLALGAIALSDIKRLFATVRAKQVLIGFGFLGAWTLVLLATIRHYSGAGWGGDWLEHFQRTLVYLHHLPAQTEIFGGYRIPSRPPLAHGIAALAMAQTSDRFEIFQIVFLFLNLLPFLPCCLLLPMIARPWKSGVLPLACIFATSPMLMMNATYTGVKTVAAFFVACAVALFLRGWRKQDSRRITLAFVCIAGGALAHYSGLPYAVFLGLFYLLFVFPRHRKWSELASLTVAAAIPLLAWFGWCMANLGTEGTFNAVVHASVGYGQETYQGSYVLRCLANLFDAIVPHPLRDWSLVQAWGQPNSLGYLRDNTFLIYQTSLVFTMGSIGGVLVYWLLFKTLRARATAERTFWAVFIPFLVVVGFLIAGERDRFGVTHLTLIAMITMGLALLAGNFTRRRWISLAIVAGCAIDFGLGVFLQVRVEHLENTATQKPFTRIQIGKTRLDVFPANSDTLSRPTGGNWFRKHQYALSEQWLRGLAASNPDGRGLTTSQASVRDALAEIVHQDDSMFGGWYKRHGGEITFFGDLFGDSEFSTGMFVTGAAILLWRLARHAPPVRAAAVAPKQPRLRKK